MTLLVLRRFGSNAEFDTALVERLEHAVSGPGAANTAVMLSAGRTPLPAYRGWLLEQVPEGLPPQRSRQRPRSLPAEKHPGSARLMPRQSRSEFTQVHRPAGPRPTMGIRSGLCNCNHP